MRIDEYCDDYDEVDANDEKIRKISGGDCGANRCRKVESQSRSLPDD